MENVMVELGALGAITAALAALWGFLGNGGRRNGLLGALMMGVAASMASGACLLGFKWGGWKGLVIGVLLVALAGGFLGSKLGKRRGALFVAFLWLGYCAACGVGYWWAEGWLGWLTIPLPSVAFFWYSLWRFSGRLLPLEIRRQQWWLLRDFWNRLFGPRQLSEEEERARRHRYLALRALVTYSMGTNYPYYVVEDGEPNKRVDGNPFRQFFAGPGILITRPHQAAVITTGMEVREIAPPGLTFTGLFDRVSQIVDLRAQLKAFDVEALTEDGIRVQALVFVLFKIRSPDLPPGRFWAEEESANAIFDAVRAQPVEDAELRNWDDLVRITGERIFQDIISHYRFDKLCARDLPNDLPPEQIPRQKIKREFTEQLKRDMITKCKGIQILGAGFANLIPMDRSVMRQCIETWRTEWTRKMMIQMGRGATEAVRLISQARAQGQAEVIRILSREAEYMDSVDRDILADVLALRLLEALEELARRPPVRRLLPTDATEMMEYLRREMGKSGLTRIQEQG